MKYIFLTFFFTIFFFSSPCYAQTWSPYPLNTAAQLAAGLTGGECSQWLKVFEYAPSNSQIIWAGYLEVFNYPPHGSGTFNSQGTVTVGNHFMDLILPNGAWVPFNEHVFFLTATSTATGLQVYNRNKSPGSWLGKVL